MSKPATSVWQQTASGQSCTDADGTEWTIAWPGVMADVVQPVTLTMRYRDHLLSSTHPDEHQAKRHRLDMLRAFAAQRMRDYTAARGE